MNEQRHETLETDQIQKKFSDEFTTFKQIFYRIMTVITELVFS